MKNAKKTIILAFSLLLTFALQAQVFILSDEEFENNKRVPDPSHGPFVPFQGSDQDQSFPVPVGDTCLLMIAFGGAYLIGKRRNNDKH